MTEPKKKSAWLIRGGEGNKFVNRCLDEGLIILGWDTTGDISGLSNPEMTNRVDANAASMLAKFRDEIEKQDVVIMPVGLRGLMGERDGVTVGIVQGGYKWRGSDASSGKHTRKVKWLYPHRSFSAKKFLKDGLRTGFDVQRPSLSRISGDDCGSWIRETVEKIRAGEIEIEEQKEKEQKDRSAEIERKKLEMAAEFGGYVRLLKQFGQIILQGPPGTGKTYTAKKIVECLLDGNHPQRRDIVQFHPSYNYEDFVRGIQIQTEDEKVVYNSVNRILAEMAEWAAKSKYPHALIIDEINRANVAAVLGELIYALEYRGETVKTPYTVDDSSDINLPENLYIIGTMNTADRTVGHLDYAVRRRFAFVTLLPNRDIVSRVSKAKNAAQWFDRVADFFQKDGGYLSPDFYREDVAIGHSYFIAENDSELWNKICYQVIPILSEYRKDGVLLPEAAEKIEELRQELRREAENYNKDTEKRR